MKDMNSATYEQYSRSSDNNCNGERVYRSTNIHKVNCENDCEHQNFAKVPIWIKKKKG